MSGQPIQKNL